MLNVRVPSARFHKSWLSTGCALQARPDGSGLSRSARRPGAQRFRFFERPGIKPGTLVSSWALRPGTDCAPERATSRRAAAPIFREAWDQTWRPCVFVVAATGDRLRSGARDVPARSGSDFSRGLGSNLVPSCLRGRCDRGPVALRVAVKGLRSLKNPAMYSSSVAEPMRKERGCVVRTVCSTFIRQADPYCDVKNQCEPNGALATLSTSLMGTGSNAATILPSGTPKIRTLPS